MLIYRRDHSRAVFPPGAAEMMGARESVVAFVHLGDTLWKKVNFWEMALSDFFA